MDKYVIDIRRIRTRKGLHKKIAETLPLPEYYGGNLDALFDVLTESSDEKEIRFLAGRQVEEALGKYYSALQAMCQAAGEENPALTVLFMEEEDS